MDQSSIVRGIGVFVYLVNSCASLVCYSHLAGSSALFGLETVEISVGIFVVALLITYQIADRLALDGGDSLLIYIPPVIPVGIFVFWLLRRRKKIRKDDA